MRPILAALLLAGSPVVGKGQIVRGLAEVATDTVHQGVFVELAGIGGITFLYEHHFGSVIAQAGFAKWSIHALPSGPKRANDIGVTSVFHEIPTDWAFDRSSFEIGAGLAGGYHVRDAWADGPVIFDSLTPPPVEQVVKVRGRYLAMTGLAGLRFKPSIRHDMTLRIGFVPILRLHDQPGSTSYFRGTFACSAGFTW